MNGLILPKSLLPEYREFVSSDPFVPVGKSYIEVFMLSKGLLPVEKQKSLEEF